MEERNKLDEIEKRMFFELKRFEQVTKAFSLLKDIRPQRSLIETAPGHDELTTLMHQQNKKQEPSEKQ